LLRVEWLLGPGFAELAVNNFSPLSRLRGLGVMSGAMILGRLEYFRLLGVVFSGFFWRH